MGTPVRWGHEFLVNTTPRYDQFLPSITALADGRFVVTWQDYSQTGDDTSGFAVRAQFFDPREVAVSLTGSALGDDFVGTGFADTMSGKLGNDQLVGKQGNDLLSGDAGNDLLSGDAGNDVLFGRRDADTLAGGTGDDTLAGNSGTDTMFFARGGGHDLVTDFQDGNDIIDLSDFGFAGFRAAANHFTSSGADVVFTAGSNTLLIQNFALAQLDTSNLIL